MPTAGTSTDSITIATSNNSVACGNCASNNIRPSSTCPTYGTCTYSAARRSTHAAPSDPASVHDCHWRTDRPAHSASISTVQTAWLPACVSATALRQAVHRPMLKRKEKTPDHLSVCIHIPVSSSYSYSCACCEQMPLLPFLNTALLYLFWFDLLDVLLIIFLCLDTQLLCSS